MIPGRGAFTIRQFCRYNQAMHAGAIAFLLQTVPMVSTAVLTALLWVTIGASLALLLVMGSFLIWGLLPPPARKPDPSLVESAAPRPLDDPGEAAFLDLETAVLLFRPKTDSDGGSYHPTQAPYLAATTQLLAHLQPSRLYASGVVQLWLRNDGLHPARCEISLHDPTGELQFSTSYHLLTLEAGQEQTYPIAITAPPRPLTGSPRLYPYQVHVTAPGHEQPKIFYGQVENSPWLPVWTWGVALLSLFLCLLAGLFAWLPGAGPAEDVAATAVAHIMLTATAQATPVITPTVALPTPTATPMLLPANCAQIRALNPTAGDGEYTLYLRGDGRFPLILYCHDMTVNPRAYLTLPNSAAGANFALIAYPEGALITHYQKVRLDPATLVVNVTDPTFATTQTAVPGYTPVAEADLSAYPVLMSNYGHAQGCNRNTTDAPRGVANIDLTGTNLAVAEGVTFVADGVIVGEPRVNISPNGQLVDLTIDGRCAQIYPTPALQLVYIP